ncbi:MAG: hypothetical protein DIU78_001645, partial [Pseudomonadota bacterium]
MAAKPTNFGRAPHRGTRNGHRHAARVVAPATVTGAASASSFAQPSRVRRQHRRSRNREGRAAGVVGPALVMGAPLASSLVQPSRAHGPATLLLAIVVGVPPASSFAQPSRVRRQHRRSRN